MAAPIARGGDGVWRDDRGSVGREGRTAAAAAAAAAPSSRSSSVRLVVGVVPSPYATIFCYN